MGDVLSGIFGTNSSVNTENRSPYQALEPWQQTAQGLSAQLQTQAAGGGPNPAQMQYLQNSQNIAQQQANTYSQNRALNPGLAARMAGNTAAGVQQQAAGTAGIQQAQQQLASQQLLGNVSFQQQEALNRAGAVNAGIAAGNQQASQGIVGGIMGGVGSALGLAHGGTVQNYPMGGMVSDPGMTMDSGGMGAGDVDSTAGIKSGAMSTAGKFLSGFGDAQSKYSAVKGFNQFAPMMAHGGKVPAMVSPGEKYLKPDQAKKVAEGKADVSHTGEKIQGKAKTKGDSEANDTVSKTLDEGGIVIPRSEMHSEKAAQAFVAKEMAKHLKSPEGEFHAALKRAVEGRKKK